LPSRGRLVEDGEEATMSERDAHQLGPLLERSRQGEAQARNALLGRLRPYLRVLIRTWLGPDLARRLADSDVVQETLLRIDQGLAGFRGQGVPELLAWARQVAYHAAIDRKRQAGLAGPAGEGGAGAGGGRGRPPAGGG